MAIIVTSCEHAMSCHVSVRVGCTAGSQLHDLVFAGYMYRLAENASSTPQFNPLEFSLGYASHMLVDNVGFHENGCV